MHKLLKYYRQYLKTGDANLFYLKVEKYLKSQDFTTSPCLFVQLNARRTEQAPKAPAQQVNSPDGFRLACLKRVWIREDPQSLNLRDS